MNQHYKGAIRSKIWNLRKNKELRMKVINSDINEEEFARMSAEEMASPKRRRTNEILRKHALEKTVVTSESNPIKSNESGGDKLELA
ncbi:9222_t:CDS:2 [Paraglomus brasilianum]|uniref:9222_t:CDS:1 n=1 Tax=Paraglomus brasilianum TaxID=144538 RepID=A0A9N8Z2B4_9GLOM|nr:9222_t:CDS:2 [Paraglomus brasilianum]